MGTLSSKKFIKNGNGQLTEEAALTTSAGAADADKLPALNASGVLDPSFINSTVASAGAGDAAKHVRLDGSGKLDVTVLPSGLGPDVKSMTTSEALAAGDFVNIHNSSGAKVRKADATTAGKHAMGFVLSAAASGASVNVYFEGANTGVTGATPGPMYLSTTAGQATATAPNGSGNVVQQIGFAVSATEINFQSGVPLILA